MLKTHMDGPLLRSAFPMALRADVDAGLSIMPPAQHRAVPTDRRARIGSEEVAILGRIYHPEPPQGLSDLTRWQKTILSTLYTRHHDGFVRERHVRQILEADHPWIPLFVLQLLGEYVVQIGQAIADHVPTLPQQTYRTFAHANPEYMSALRSRVVSYWSEYYRRTPLSEYPAYRALDALGLWQGPEGKRILTRAVGNFKSNDEASVWVRVVPEFELVDDARIKFVEWLADRGLYPEQIDPIDIRIDVSRRADNQPAARYWVKAAALVRPSPIHRGAATQVERGAAQRAVEELLQPGHVVQSDAVLETADFWIFPYQSALFLKTNQPSQQLAGNAPYLVERGTGWIRVTGTAQPLEHYLELWRRNPEHLGIALRRKE